MVFITPSLLEAKNQGLARSFLLCHPHTFNGPLKVCYFIGKSYYERGMNSCKSPAFPFPDLQGKPYRCIDHHRDRAFVQKKFRSQQTNTNEDLSKGLFGKKIWGKKKTHTVNLKQAILRCFNQIHASDLEKQGKDRELGKGGKLVGCGWIIAHYKWISSSDKY